MKIYELHLKNCKCYEDKIINFQEGINFISGVNGAGKTTIIEAIGLVLFNYLPYNSKQFVRDGKKSGEIQILIEAKDERLYRIIRKFNKTSKSVKWEVYDEETKTTLDELHGSDDVSLWIKESIGVDPEDSLEKIFEQVIAVDQGLFAAPFLETNANRKRIFDEILKVEGYRQAFEKSRSLKNFIDGEEKELQTKAQYLEEEIIKVPAIEEEIAKKIDEQKAEAKKYELAQQKQQELEKKETEWTKLKEAREAKNNKKKLLEQKLISLKENIESLEKQKEEAKRARKIVEETKETYKRYQQNQVELKKWEEKKKAKDTLKAELEKKEKAYYTEEKGIEVESKNNEAIEKELAKKLKELQKETEDTSKKLEEIEKDQKEVAFWGGKTKEARELYDALRNWFDNKHKLVTGVSYELQGIEESEVQIEEIKERLKDLPQREKDLTVLSALLEKGEGLLQEKSSLEARREALKQNEIHLTEGRCPIIQEPCPSQKVAGDLSGYFAKELTEIKTELEELKEKLELQKEQRKKYEKLNTQIVLAKDEEKRMKDLAKTREDKIKGLRLLLESFSLKEIIGIIQKVQSEYLKLESLNKEINPWLQSKDFITQDSFTFEGLEDKECLALLSEMEGTTLDDTKLIRTWLTKWDQLEVEKERWLEKGQDEVKEFRQWLIDIYQDINSRVQKVRQHEGYCLKEIKDYESQVEGLKKKKAELETRRDNLESLKDKISKLKEGLEQFAGVEDKVDTLKKELERDQEYYDKYKENKQTSERLEKIVQDIKKYHFEAEEITKKIEGLIIELKELLSKYDSEKHEELKKELREVTTKVTELKFSLEQIKQVMDQLKEQLDTLLKKKEEWEENKKKLLVKKKTKELTLTIRDTLKNAADPIAQVYRQHLSAQANEIYRHVSNENVQVEWASEYELQLKDNHNSKERIRVFKQLSGGEQMTAALAIRLALMKMLSDVKVGFFDEPTTNLDADRRQNLATTIQNSTKGFEQIFVISHDDAFDALTENTISLEKDDGYGTKVNASRDGSRLPGKK